MFGTGSIQMTPLWTLETALYSRSQKRADLKMMSKIDFLISLILKVMFYPLSLIDSIFETATILSNIESSNTLIQ